MIKSKSCGMSRNSKCKKGSNDKPNTSAPIFIVSVFIIYEERFIIFKRDDGFYGPITGKVDVNETCIGAIIREVKEEASIFLKQIQINCVDHEFLCLSPKGKMVYGKTFYSILDSTIFDFSGINLNSELLDYKLFSPKVSCELIKKCGQPEAYEGIQAVSESLKTGRGNISRAASELP